MKPKPRTPKQRPALMTLKTITPHHLYALVRTFCQLHPKPKTRGRLPIYPEELILTLALMMTQMNTSYATCFVFDVAGSIALWAIDESGRNRGGIG